MKFAHQNDIVLIVAAHIWRHGNRLLPYHTSYVRGSIPDIFVHIEGICGIHVVYAGSYRDMADAIFYASGTPSS